MLQIEWAGWERRKWGTAGPGYPAHGLQYKGGLFLGPLHIHVWKLVRA